MPTDESARPIDSFVCVFCPESRAGWLLGGSDAAMPREAAPEMQSVLATDDFLHAGAFGELRQGNAVEEFMNLHAEVSPQFVGKATVAVLAVFLAAAAGDVHTLVNGGDDIRHRYLFRRPGQPITAARTTGAGDETAATQAREDLFQVGERYSLTCRNIRECHRPIHLVYGQIHHSGDRVAAFGR